MDREPKRSSNPDDTWTSDALKRGDVHAVKMRSWEDRAYVASRDYLDNTPLMAAIAYEDVDLVGYLLRMGSNPNAEAADGEPPLFLAIEAEKPEMAHATTLLINAGANVHILGKNGWTPLHLAACLGRLEQAKMLLDARARVNERATIDGERTPLLEAAHQGHSAMVRLLLDRGADPSLRDTISGLDAIEIAVHAARGADPEVIETLKAVYAKPIDNSFLDEMDVPPELREFAKGQLASVDIVESYREAADELARLGDHAGVIRIIEAFKAR